MSEISVLDALNEYYKLKNTYSEKYNQTYVDPILKKRVSTKEKRLEYASLPKPECINCKRNVGTIFSETADKENMIKKYIAKCGDLSDPCPLDINIQYAMRLKLDKHIIDTLRDLENIKVDIIKSKNDSLFFNEDIVSKFEKLTEELKYATETSGIVIEYNLLKNENPIRTELIKKNIDIFGQDCIIPFKQMITEYLAKNDQLKITEAIRFYSEEMIPKLKEIMDLKYKVNYVEYDNTLHTFSLIQRKNAIIDNEYYFEEDDKVISFVKGVKKTIKTPKTAKINVVSKSKTKKKKIMEEDFEIIEEPLELENKDKEIPIETPNKIEISSGYDLIWNNNDYQTLWKRLPEKLRNILSGDEIWASDFMYNCLMSRKNKVACRMILPKHATIPPQILADGSFDFGIPTLNMIINEQPKFFKDLLLTLYTKEEDGTINYNMMKDAIAKSIEKYVDFENGYF
jgi:hypothetical protein